MTKSEQTKAFIIERTAPLFNKKGYAGTSMSDITDATRLTKGCIYGNFTNKDEVALAAFDYNVKKLNAVIQEEMDKEDSARGKLLVYAKLYGKYPDNPFPPGGCPILNTATESDDTHPELRKKVRGAITSWKKKLAGIVETGIKAKEFSKKTDPDQVALVIIALLEGGMMIAGVLDKPAYRASIMQAMAGYINSID